MVAPRKYAEEVRARAIRFVLDARKDPARGQGRRPDGKQLGINSETLRGWVTQAEVNADGRPGSRSPTSRVPRHRVADVVGKAQEAACARS